MPQIAPSEAASHPYMVAESGMHFERPKRIILSRHRGLAQAKEWIKATYDVIEIEDDPMNPGTADACVMLGADMRILTIEPYSGE